MSKKNAKKKEKVKYIDDGRTLSDMSGVRGGFASRPSGAGRPTFKECFKTYIDAVKMMFAPMLVVLLFICIAFMIMYLIFLGAA